MHEGAIIAMKMTVDHSNRVIHEWIVAQMDDLGSFETYSGVRWMMEGHEDAMKGDTWMR